MKRNEGKLPISRLVISTYLFPFFKSSSLIYILAIMSCFLHCISMLPYMSLLVYSLATN